MCDNILYQNYATLVQHHRWAGGITKNQLLDFEKKLAMGESGVQTKNKPKNIIMWALTYDCNAKCEYCYLKDYKQPIPTVTKNQYFEIAKKLVESSFKADAIWLTGGEPTILSFLPELIAFFKANNVEVVLNTNSIVRDDFLLKILEAEPTGVVVSLDSTLENEMLKSRKRTFSAHNVLERLKFIKQHKSNNTILGTAVVLTSDAINNLYDYAVEVAKIGVEYISLNPMYGEGKPSATDVAILQTNIQKIKQDSAVLLPSDYYLSLIYQYYNDELTEHFCPSLYNYFFISPWGYIYPCSNEMWQTFNGFEFDITTAKGDWYEQISSMRNTYLKSWRKTTLSSCFSSRCIGCFKVYYDTIFTKNK